MFDDFDDEEDEFDLYKNEADEWYDNNLRFSTGRIILKVCLWRLNCFIIRCINPL